MGNKLESTPDQNLIEIILTGIFVLSLSKAQRSRFHASCSMEPQLIKCTFQLPIMHRDS